MSYLGYPRITFAGRFQADVSTINNDPAHFNDATFQPRFQQFGNDNGWWNPRGSGAWRFAGCNVTSGFLADGTPVSPIDPAASAVLGQADDRVSAKLVDLDPEQQMVSMIFGLRLALRLPDGTKGFEGDFVPAPFWDIWVRYPQGQPDSWFGAFYQSVIDTTAWPDDVGSPLLQDLRAASSDGMLSIKFNVDGMNMADPTAPEFTWGRVVGSIGPYLAGEPQQFVAARLLRQPSGSPLNAAYCRVDEPSSTLFLDLGNSLPTTSAGGPIAPQPPLTLATTPAEGDPVVLGSIDPCAETFYERSAGIVAMRLTPAQLQAVLESPLALTGGVSPIGGPQTLLAENADATYLRADQFVFRMNPTAPHNTETTTLYATKLGKPAAGVEVTTGYDDSPMLSQQTQGPVPGPPPGVPKDAFTFPQSVTTGPDGTAELTLTAAPPGNPRGYIDGQVYCCQYGWNGDPSVPNGAELYALVFDEHPVPPEPTWVADIQPVLQQYANLYPVMRDVLDLSDYADVIRYRRGLKLALGLPITDPNYMPVTRDLSPSKQKMILDWLALPEPPVFRIDTVEDLRQVLQLAVQLEHATIPPYLAAFWSIKEGQNTEVAELIHSVVMQEMLHMALACNLLNAVGGSPQIDVPGFIPTYPGHLPAGLRPDLTVTLRRCTKQHVRDVFMSIEEPGETWVPEGCEVPDEIDVRGIEVDDDGRLASDASEAVEALKLHFTHVEHHPFTIGWFYKQVGEAIIRLDKEGNIFTGDASKQMTPAIYDGPPGVIYAIDSVETALLALHEIERQGEGTTLTDPTDERGELAHYFRFGEIVEGRRMIKDPERGWVYEGERIPFDPAGVTPMIDDPETGLLPDGSQARMRSQLFDRVYSDLLRCMHEMFNGRPELLGRAVGLMFSAEVTARQLLGTPLEGRPDVSPGPAFQFAPPA